MEKETLIVFLNIRVFLTKKSNGYKYIGNLLKVSKDSIILDDRFDGPTVISIDDVGSIREANPND